MGRTIAFRKRDNAKIFDPILPLYRQKQPGTSRAIPGGPFEGHSRIPTFGGIGRFPTFGIGCD